MGIDIRQIRAARGLLGWSQRTLAEEAGLSLNAVNNLERGAVQPHDNTLGRIMVRLEQAGVEFLGDYGVRLVADILDVKCFEGAHALAHMRREVFEYGVVGMDLMLMGIDERLFAKYDDGSLMADLRRYHETKISEKILIAEDDGHFLSPFAEYRWLSASFVGQVPHIIYGDRVVFIYWGAPLRVLRIHHRPMAATFRQQFMSFWQRAKIARMPPRI